ncbi:amino acid aminotransferase [Cupriavidus sp. AcVe19-6a]|uniref:amino acid aminotransferase n=1 Tax=Cupriavidus sp. AcVe19-6a TaxID=2821358 RepID=UPI001AE10F64|nr:amino acid aminotransferase [Cupriavidus sp. AcVe19-6a]MBP0640078.1 aspartate/tyrosine/aromatic aminotransferase [Cupriavidus sp. AcVe19-6a]
MLDHVGSYAGDPILSLMEKFAADETVGKANLGIGLYYDDNGRIPILCSVGEAAQALRNNPQPHTYLPMEGLSRLRECIQDLVFGKDTDAVREGRVATIQTIGGSGALHVAARFIRAYFPDSAVWISDPTWDNHRPLLESAGLNVGVYPYYDAKTQGVDIEGMIATLNGLPEKSIVLLQPSCHNPTGCDLTPDQWDRVVDIMEQRRLIPFMDMAYQGFGDGLNEDASPIRKLIARSMTVFVSNSFSKNFSLYGERVGGLSVVCANADVAGRVLGQLKSIVRTIYSSPPLHGARIIATVLEDPTMHQMWEAEIEQMRVRIKSMRKILREVMEANIPSMDASYLTTQRGMFSYTGLTPEETFWLKDEKAIYMVQSGRICVAGLSEQNAPRVAEALAEVMARRQQVAALTGC